MTECLGNQGQIDGGAEAEGWRAPCLLTTRPQDFCLLGTNRVFLPGGYRSAYPVPLGVCVGGTDSFCLPLLHNQPPPCGAELGFSQDPMGGSW